MAITNYIGKIRLVKQPYVNNSRIEDERGGVRYIYKHQPEPKLQQFDGKDWVDVEIVELEDVQK